jgi:CBS domain-containing protein
MEDIKTMKASDVMTREVQTIRPGQSLREAARPMDELNGGILPVCDGRRLVGMITDRDITVRSTSAGQNPEKTQVQDVMTAEVHWCFEDDDTSDVARLMSDVQIRRIPVVDRNKHLVGIIALGDLATDETAVASEALQQISEPSRPDRSGSPAGR